MFNLSGSEIIVILLLALVILGPEKLPDAMRKAGRAYSELRKMANSFQSEVRSALDEPMTELRGTADAIRDATSFTGDAKTTGRAKPAGTTSTAVPDPDPDPDLDSDLDADLDLEQELEPDPAAITYVLEGDDDDDDDDQGPDEDAITRTLSGDVEPASPSDTRRPDS